MIKNVVGGAAALVSFELPSSVSADSVSVCGDFNDWAPGAQPLARLEGGGFRAVLELPTGRRWRFRYLLDGGRWENDWAADDYIPNQHGSHDSVVDLTTGALPSASASAEPTPEPAAAVSDSEVTEVAEVAEIVPAARPRTRKRVAAESSGSVAGAPKTSARTRKAVAAPAAEPQAGVDAVPVAAGATTSRKRKPRKATE